MTALRSSRATRLHAARVAAAAAVLVVACYVVGVIALDLVVGHRLTSEVDTRLSKHLSASSIQVLLKSGSSGERVDNGTDLDDAPFFLWQITRSGTVRSLTSGAPALPDVRWTTEPVTIAVGSAPFRFDVVRLGPDQVVAGQSVAQIQHVRNLLVLPELLFGLLLLAAVFAGAWVIGLRASAPLELVRRRQAEFTADASHELRTPLSVIEAEVELALSRQRDADDYQSILRRVAGEGKRLRHIVDDLLWLARADDAATPLQAQQSCDLAAVASACAERFRPVTESRGSRLTVSEPETGSSVVPGSPEWIDRLVGVLVDNACKFAGPNGKVELRVVVSGARVGLEVHDSGPGIAPEDRPAVFDRFRHATGSTGGTGLGLAIADSIVRATHGTWAVGTSPLGGACMEVWWRKASPDRDSIVARAFDASEARSSLPAR